MPIHLWTKSEDDVTKFSCKFCNPGLFSLIEVHLDLNEYDWSMWKIGAGADGSMENN